MTRSSTSTERLASFALLAAALVFPAIVLAAHTRLGPRLGLPTSLGSVATPDLARWVVIELVLIGLIPLAARRAVLAHAARAARIASPRRSAAGTRSSVVPLLLATFALFVALEAPASDPPSEHGRRVSERHAYPSLLAGAVTGDFVYQPDTGGALGLAKGSYDELRRLHFPLWEPHVGAGRPTYPIDFYSYGNLDPLQWVAIAVSAGSTNRTIVLSSILYVGLIVLGVFGLASRAGLSPRAASIAALLLLASPFLQAYPNFTQLYQMPLAGGLVIAIALERVFARGGLVWISVAAIAVGWLTLNIVVAVPAIGIMGICTLVAHGLSTRATAREWWIATGRFAAVLALGGAIGLAHVIPLSAFAREATNQRLPYIGQGFSLERGWEAFERWFAAAPIAWQLAITGVLATWRLERLRYPLVLGLTSSAFGFLGWAGAFDRLALAVGYNSQHVNSFGPALSLGSAILVALGVEALLRPEPLPGPMLLFFSLAALLAGWLCDKAGTLVTVGPVLLLLALPSRRGRSPVAAGAITAVLAVVAATLSARNSIASSYLTGLALPAARETLLDGAMLALAALGFLATVALAVRHRSSRLPLGPRRALAGFRRAVLPVALLAAVLASADVAPRGWVVQSSVDDLEVEPLFARVLEASRPDYRVTSLHPTQDGLPVTLTDKRADAMPFYPLMATLFRYADAGGSASLTVGRYSDFVDYASFGAVFGSPRHPAERLRDREGNYHDLERSKRINILISDVSSPLWRYAALRYVLSETRLDQPRLTLLGEVERPRTYGRHLERKARLERVFVYELADALPRAYVPDEVASVGAFGEEEVKALETGARAAGRFAAVLDPTATPGARMRQSRPGTARIASETGRTVELAADLADDGYVVLSDTWFPGWRAEVDGREAPVLLANYAFRAVRVPAGAHRVVLTFLPSAVLRGAAIGGAALVLCLAGLIAGLLRRREA